MTDKMPTASSNNSRSLVLALCAALAFLSGSAAHAAKRNKKSLRTYGSGKPTLHIKGLKPRQCDRFAKRMLYEKGPWGMGLARTVLCGKTRKKADFSLRIRQKKDDVVLTAKVTKQPGYTKQHRVLEESLPKILRNDRKATALAILALDLFPYFSIAKSDDQKRVAWRRDKAAGEPPASMTFFRLQKAPQGVFLARRPQTVMKRKGTYAASKKQLGFKTGHLALSDSSATDAAIETITPTTGLDFRKLPHLELLFSSPVLPGSIVQNATEFGLVGYLPFSTSVWTLMGLSSLAVEAEGEVNTITRYQRQLVELAGEYQMIKFRLGIPIHLNLGAVLSWYAMDAAVRSETGEEVIDGSSPAIGALLAFQSGSVRLWGSGQAGQGSLRRVTAQGGLSYHWQWSSWSGSFGALGENTTLESNEEGRRFAGFVNRQVYGRISLGHHW